MFIVVTQPQIPECQSEYQCPGTGGGPYTAGTVYCVTLALLHIHGSAGWCVHRRPNICKIAPPPHLQVCRHRPSSYEGE